MTDWSAPLRQSCSLTSIRIVSSPWEPFWDRLDRVTGCILGRVNDQFPKNFIRCWSRRHMKSSSVLGRRSLVRDERLQSVSFYMEGEWSAIHGLCMSRSVLQGEIYVSSMTCLGKNTANIWIHQVVRKRKGGESLTWAHTWWLAWSHNLRLYFVSNRESVKSYQMKWVFWRGCNRHLWIRLSILSAVLLEATGWISQYTSLNQNFQCLCVHRRKVPSLQGVFRFKQCE